MNYIAAAAILASFAGWAFFAQTVANYRRYRARAKARHARLIADARIAEHRAHIYLLRLRERQAADQDGQDHRG